MRLVDKALLKIVAACPNCECCGARTPNGADPHHIYSKGAGRVDIPENLVALCRSCHNGYHYSSKPSLQDLLTIVAIREGMIAEDIEKEVFRIRNLDKDGKPRREMP